MTILDVAAIAARANLEAARSRRRGAPTLTADSTIPEIAAWLQWCDPNGCHTTELAELSGCDPYETTDDAWENVADMLAWDD